METDKKLYFLGGLHRSGSTLLSCILNQNPNIYSSATSPLVDVLISSGKSLEESRSTYTFDFDSHNRNLIHGILDNFYLHKNYQIIIDKHRGWPSVIQMLKFHYHSPKIICTNRKIPEVITSFIKLLDKDPNNFIDNELLENQYEITVRNRAHYIFLNLINPIRSLIINSLENHRECIHMVEYDDLVSNPQETIYKIYNFLDVNHYNHNFMNINNNEENDSLWNIKDLHKVRNKIQRNNFCPYDVLGNDLVELYSQFNIKYS